MKAALRRTIVALPPSPSRAASGRRLPSSPLPGCDTVEGLFTCAQGGATFARQGRALQAMARRTVPKGEAIHERAVEGWLHRPGWGSEARPLLGGMKGCLGDAREKQVAFRGSGRRRRRPPRVGSPSTGAPPAPRRDLIRISIRIPPVAGDRRDRDVLSPPRTSNGSRQSETKRKAVERRSWRHPTGGSGAGHDDGRSWCTGWGPAPATENPKEGIQPGSKVRAATPRQGQGGKRTKKRSSLSRRRGASGGRATLHSDGRPEQRRGA